VGEVLYTTVDWLFGILTLLIFARVILSFLPQYRYSQIGELVYGLTEPILSPFQRVLPPVGMFDLSPMVAIITLYILRVILLAFIQSLFGLPLS
jgi:YggT family protein